MSVNKAMNAWHVSLTIPLSPSLAVKHHLWTRLYTRAMSELQRRAQPHLREMRERAITYGMGGALLLQYDRGDARTHPPTAMVVILFYDPHQRHGDAIWQPKRERITIRA